MDGDLAISNTSSARLTGAESTSYDLCHRTPGERLWLWRLSCRSPSRKQRGIGSDSGRLTQFEAATALGFDINAYRALELDEASEANAKHLEAALCHISEPPYTLGAACKLARRRSKPGLTVAQAVSELGLVSLPTFYSLEAVGDLRIVAFWAAKGFEFPKFE